VETYKRRKIVRKRRHKGIRSRILSTGKTRPRLCVHRSLKHIYAQIVDDMSSRSLVQVSSRSLGEKLKKMEQSGRIGTIVAEKAIALGIKQVVFDRSGYLYHGRVKALADAARKGGLKF
jgi:large subunit ribosomal protein L18